MSTLANAFTGFYLPCADVFRGLVPADEPCYYDYGFAALRPARAIPR